MDVKKKKENLKKLIKDTDDFIQTRRIRQNINVQQSININLKKCPKCGTVIAPDAKYCHICGYSLN